MTGFLRASFQPTLRLVATLAVAGAMTLAGCEKAAPIAPPSPQRSVRTALPAEGQLGPASWIGAADATHLYLATVQLGWGVDGAPTQLNLHASSDAGVTWRSVGIVPDTSSADIKLFGQQTLLTGSVTRTATRVAPSVFSGDTPTPAAQQDVLQATFDGGAHWGGHPVQHAAHRRGSERRWRLRHYGRRNGPRVRPRLEEHPSVGAPAEPSSCAAR